MAGQDNPSVLAALADAKRTDQIVPVPRDPSPPDTIVCEEAADGFADRAELATGHADQEHEVDDLDNETSVQAIKSFETIPKPKLPSGSIAPVSDSRFEHSENLPTDSMDDPSSLRPPSAAEAVDWTLPIAPLPNDDTGLDADQTLQRDRRPLLARVQLRPSHKKPKRLARPQASNPGGKGSSGY